MQIDKNGTYDDSRMTETSFPMILRPLKQKLNQSNKSLFKNDSEYSQLPQRTQIVRKDSNINQIKKFMRKVDQFNTLNYQQLKAQKQFAQFPHKDRSSASLYKLGRDISLENADVEDRRKEVKRIYMGNLTKNKKIQYRKKFIQPVVKNKIDKEIQTDKFIQKKSYGKEISTSKNKIQLNTISNKEKLEHLSSIKEDNHDEEILPRKNCNRRSLKVGKNGLVEENINQTLGVVSKQSHKFHQEVKRYSRNRFQEQQLSTIFSNSKTADIKPIIPLGDGFSGPSETQSRKIFNFDLSKQQPTPTKKSKFIPENSVIPQKGLKTEQAKSTNELLSILAQKSENTYDCTPEQNEYCHKMANNTLKNREVSIQVPQISELKVCKYQDNQLKSKSTHPIHNDFHEKDAHWITNKFKPQSNLISNISLKNFLIKKYRNGVYFGQLDNEGNKHGKGVIFYFNGRTYEGQFNQDIKEGKGFEIFPDGSKYNGQFVRGAKDGKGVFEWHNGEIFDGQWLAGKKNGSGIWKSPLGDSYIGEWKNGKVQGFGVFVIANGDRYQGQFKNSLKHGLGTQRYHNGQTYVGNYLKNRPNGQGQYYWSNGDYYKGHFSNGLRHGQGMFKDTNKDSIYKGQYRNDKKCGYGELSFSGGQTYIGNFQNNLKHGYGQLYSGNECLFKGYWLNDKQVDSQFGPIAEQQMDRNGSIKKIESKKKRNDKSRKKSSKNKKISISKSKSKSLQRKVSSEPYKRACGCSRKH